MTDKVMHQVRLFLILGILKNTYVIYTNSDLPNFPFTSIPLPATTQNGRVAGLVVSPFRFSKISPKCLTSNPLPQIVTSNPRSQPDTHFAVDMFPYKKTELFQKSGFKSKPPKKPGNTPLSGTYLSFLDINTTVSTCPLHGNISTVRTRSTWYPLSPRYFTSLARVAESQLT